MSEVVTAEAVRFDSLSATNDGYTLLSNNGKLCKSNKKLSEMVGPSGGEGAAIFDLVDYFDRHDPESLKSDALWRDMVNAMLDNKAVALKLPLEDEDVYAIGWSDRSFRLPEDYTKEEYIEYLLTELDNDLLVLTFRIGAPAFGGKIDMQYVLDVTPDGIKINYAALILPSYGIILEAAMGDGIITESSLMPMNAEGTNIDWSRVGDCASDAFAHGIPVTLEANDMSQSFSFHLLTVDRIDVTSPLRSVDTKKFHVEAHGDATWIVQGDYYDTDLKAFYKVDYSWVQDVDDDSDDGDDDENENQISSKTTGHFEATDDEVYPIAVDERFVPVNNNDDEIQY